MDVIQLISSVGFPIVACLGMGWYVKYQTDSYREEVKDMQKEHKEEIQKMSDALNNNTAALQRLCDKLDGGEQNGR
jgi:Skp family chaperone for outer membrane proteins